MKQEAMTGRGPAFWPVTVVAKAVSLTLLMISLSGCSSSPEFNILGSYFPSWLVCLAMAGAVTFAAHVAITKLRMASQLWPLPLVYTSLICFISCTFWIIFFE
jgi:YtcA family